MPTTPTYTPDHVVMSTIRDGVIPAEQGQLILKEVMHNSAVMQLAKYEPMTAQRKTFTFRTKGLNGYWVGETERIRTAKVEYDTAEMEAKKVGVIIPVSKEFLKWTAKDFFNEVKPLIAEAFYKMFDQAVLFGTDSPYNVATSGKPILVGATESGNTVVKSDNLYDDISGAMALVEEDGLDPNGILTTRSFKSMLRSAKDANGIPLFDQNANAVLGLPTTYTGTDVFDRTKALSILGDWDFARYGILQGIEFAISTDASLTTIAASDAPGVPVNLFERDMFALRATMHIGYMNVNPNAFAAVTPAV